MINGTSLRTIWEACDRQPQRFMPLMEGVLGLTFDQNGARCIREQQVAPAEFSFKEMAEVLIGEDWHQIMQSPEGQYPVFVVREDGTTDVHSSAFSNVNVFKALAAGTVEARILARYNFADRIANQLVTTMSTNKNGEKIVGAGGIGDKALDMNPGDPHPRAKIGERWVETPQLQKQGLAIDVLHETIHFDNNNLVMTEADRVGEWLSLRKEKTVLDTFLGIDNSYVYKGTAYNTYQAAGTWDNDFTNELVDFTDVENADLSFVDLVDPETGERIVINPQDVLVVPHLRIRAQQIFNADEVMIVSGGVVSGTDQAEFNTRGRNPIAGRGYRVLQSTLTYQRLIDSGISASNAAKYWFYGNFRQAFAYMEAWSLRVQRANPTNYHMLDHDLAFSIFANEMGIPAVLDPRQVQRHHG